MNGPSPRQSWPKREGGETFQHYVQRWLKSGDRDPFDAHQPEGDEDFVVPEYGDWAVRAARGIIAEFGDRGATFNEAFHTEKVSEETRIEIIDVMAALIREALRQDRETED